MTEAYNDKYHGQYPIDLMVSDPVAKATIAIVKKKKNEEEKFIYFIDGQHPFNFDRALKPR